MVGCDGPPGSEHSPGDHTVDDASHHIHVATPGDHYSGITGSAVMTLIYEFTRQHLRAGGRSQIVVGHNTRHDYEAGEHLVVNFGPYPTKIQKILDVGLARLGHERTYINDAYAPAVSAIDPDFAGSLFIQNTPGPARLFKRRLPKAQICINAHNELFNTYSDRELERTIGAVDRIIFNCHFLARQLLERLPSAADRVRVVHNGLDTERFIPRPELASPDEVTILFVARMVPSKGADLLIKAALKLRTRGKRFRLRIVGSRGFASTEPLSPYEKSLRKLAAPLEGQIEFIPSTDRQQILPIYQSASIFCAPSNYNEPCTLTVPESMACGVPVVASRRGGITEIGRDAILYFEPPDSDELADILSGLIDSEEERLAWGRRARRRAEEFDWSILYQHQRDALLDGDYEDSAAAGCASWNRSRCHRVSGVI